MLGLTGFIWKYKPILNLIISKHPSKHFLENNMIKQVNNLGTNCLE